MATVKDETLLQEFSNLLKRRRKDLSISQKEAAERCDISEAAIAMFETRRRHPTPEMVLKIMHGLDLSVEELVPFVPISLRPMLEREAGRQLLTTAPELDGLSPDEMRRLEEAFLNELPRVPLLEHLRPEHIGTNNELERTVLEEKSTRFVYGLGVTWPGAFLLEIQGRDPDSPLEGCYRVLIAPDLDVAPGGYAVIVRPHGYALRRVFPTDEYLIIESQSNREVIQHKKFRDLVEDRRAALLPVVETYVRHEQPPRPSLFR